MILIAVSASNMLLRDAHMINRLKLSTEALYIAEAGASVALGSLADTVLVGWSAGTANGALGDGTYSYTISQVGARWLITSTGTVRGVSKTVSLEVENLFPPAMNYALVCGGDVDMKSNQGDCTILGDIHANGDMDLRAQGPGPTVLSVQALAPATGMSTAFGTYTESTTGGNQVIIADPSTHYRDAIPMPTFDFGSLKATAQATGNYVVPPGGVGGMQTYNNAAVTGGVSDITYVDGDVTFQGNCTISGGLVAFGDITLNNGNTISQTIPIGCEYPIFMSQQGSRIRLYGTFNADATTPTLIYATNDIKIQTPGGSPTVMGTVIAGGSLETTANGDITFTYAQVVADEVIPQGMVIISWNR